MPKRKPKPKQWPADGSVVDLILLTQPLRDAFCDFYGGLPQQRVMGVKYTGYGTPNTRHACPQPDWELSNDGTIANEDQGRSPFDTIIGIAVRLGIEQGIRMAAEKNATRDLVDRTATALQRLLNEE